MVKVRKFSLILPRKVDENKETTACRHIRMVRAVYYETTVYSLYVERYFVARSRQSAMIAWKSRRISMSESVIDRILRASAFARTARLAE